MPRGNSNWRFRSLIMLGSHSHSRCCSVLALKLLESDLTYRGLSAWLSNYLVVRP